MLEAGAEVVETDTFQGSRLKLEEWGLGEHTLEINRKAAEIARKAAGEDRFVAGSIGPTGFLPASDDPTLGRHHLPRAGRGLRRAGARPGRGRRRPDHHRDRAGHPRGEGGDLRRPRGVQARPAARCRSRLSVSLLPQGGKMLLGTDIQAVLTTLDGARRRRRSGSTARPGPRTCATRSATSASTRPLPVHCIPNAGLPLQGPDGETIFPEEPEPLARDAGRVRRALRRRHRRRLLRHDARAHRARSRERVGGRAPGERPAPGRSQVSSMMTATPLVQEPRADAGRRAGQLAGLAQGQGAAARRRLRRPRRRSPRTRSTAAPTCSTSASR